MIKKGREAVRKWSSADNLQREIAALEQEEALFHQAQECARLVVQANGREFAQFPIWDELRDGMWQQLLLSSQIRAGIEKMQTRGAKIASFSPEALRQIEGASPSLRNKIPDVAFAPAKMGKTILGTEERLENSPIFSFRNLCLNPNDEARTVFERISGWKEALPSAS